MSPNTQSRLNKQDGVQPQQDFQYVITADAFKYRGNVVRLQSKLDALHTTKNKQFNDVRIKIMGNMVKQRNTGCQIATLFFGILLIFPIFFMCCKWWRKMVYPAYEVPQSTYKKLQAVFQTPTIRSVTLKVTDNAFNEAKAKILYNLLYKSSAKGFSFTNLATPNDYRQNEYSNFGVYMKQLKKLKMMTDLKWFDKIVEASKQGKLDEMDPDNS